MKIVVCVKSKAIVANLSKLLPEDEIVAVSLAESPDEIENADVLVPSMAKITKETIVKAKSLKLIQQYGAGLDGVDIQAATEKGIYVANVPSEHTGNGESVAELAILLMLSLARNFAQARENLKKRKTGSPIGTTLKGKTAGIVGAGGIGKSLIKRLKALEMEIMAISKHPSEAKRKELGIDFYGGPEDLPRVLRAADFVILCTPLTEETRGIIGKAELTMMKNTAFLINVGRGPLIDYPALLWALENKVIAGVGLDVFWQEPPDPADPIFQYNTVATPHIGGATDISLRMIGEAVAENINRFRRGEKPLHCVNKSK
ncbi:MAG: 2-hydroxyacid dehydrogenase [Bacillota bacterium]